MPEIDIFKRMDSGGLFDDESTGLEDASFFNGMPDTKDSVLKKEFQTANKTPPDDYAETLDLSQKTGIPEDVVGRNKTEVKQNTNVPDFSKMNEGMKDRLMKDPAYIKLAGDDIDNLSFWDETFGYIESLGDDFERGQKMVTLGKLRNRQLLGHFQKNLGIPGDSFGLELSEDESREADEISTFFNSRAQDKQSYLAGHFPTAAEQLPIFGHILLRAGQFGGTTGAITAGAAMTTTALAGTIFLPTVPEEILTVPVAGVGGFVTGFVPGAKVGSAFAAFELEGGLAFDEFRSLKDEEGNILDPDIAAYSALMVGVINAGFEFVSISKLGKTFQGAKSLIKKKIKDLVATKSGREILKQVGQRYLVSVGTEGLTEFMQEWTNIIVGETAKAVDTGSFKDSDVDNLLDTIFTTEHLERTVASAKKGVQAATVLGVPGSTISVVAETRRAKQAKSSKSILDGLGESSKESKFRERNVGKYQEYVKDALQGSDAESVSIPGEQLMEFFQANENSIEDFRKVVPDIDDQLEQAVATGGDVVIQTDALAAHIAPLEYYEQLVKDIRVRSGDMTIREAEQFDAAIEEQLINDYQEFASEVDRSESAAASGQQVFDDVVSQLEAAGQSTQVAEKAAVLHKAFFETMASRTGIDAFELYQAQNLRIRSDIQRDELDAAIDLARTGKGPTQEQAFGPSLTEFLRGKGGLTDVGGELAARDLGKTEPFQRSLIQAEGLDLDEAIQVAREAGFIPEAPTDRPDEFSANELLELIDAEAGGQPLFTEQRADEEAAALRGQIGDIEQLLGQAGLDIAQMNNQEIKDFLEGIVGTELSQKDKDIIKRAKETDETGAIIDTGIKVEEITDAETREKARALLARQRARKPENIGSTLSGRSPAEAWYRHTKITRNGSPTIVYRGSGTGLTGGNFNEESLGKSSGVPASGLGVYFSTKESDAQEYADQFEAGVVDPVFLDFRNPKILTLSDLAVLTIEGHFKTVADAAALRELYILEGHDSVAINQGDGTYHLVAFDEDQVIPVSPEGVELFQAEGGERKKAQANDIGLYSAVEQSVLDMKLPAWNKRENRVLSDEERARYEEIRDNDKLHFTSTEQEGYKEYVELQKKRQAEIPAANGNEIFSKIKSTPGVKKEEIKWLALEDFLKSKPKFTRQEVIDFAKDNGIKIEETVAEEGEGDTQAEFNWTETIDDDSDNWQYIVEDDVYEYERSSSSEDFHFFDTEEWIDANSDVVVKHYDSLISDEEREGFEKAEKEQDLFNWLEDNAYTPFDDLQSKMQRDFEEAAEAAAEEQYMENPYRTWNDSKTDYVITGNDDVGYTLNGQFTEAYSFSEAEIKATELAFDEGAFADEQDEGTAKWGEYVMDGDSENYRELKLILPDIESDFYNDVHFPDRNIVAFLRVSDRELVGEPIKAKPVIKKYDHGWAIEDAATGTLLSDGFFSTEDQANEAFKDGDYSDTVGGDEKRTYFIEEFQSDWHQQGRQKGYATGELDAGELDLEAADIRKEFSDGVDAFREKLAAARDDETVTDSRRLDSLLNSFEGTDRDPISFLDEHIRTILEIKKKPLIVIDGKPETYQEHFESFPATDIGRIVYDAITEKEIAEFEALDKAEAAKIKQAEAERYGTPDAPFKGDNWMNMGLKRAIVDAVENGYEAIAWAASETHVAQWSERYRQLYQNQYDKKMPSLFKKATKIKPTNIDGDYWIAEITPELIESVKAEGLALFQEDVPRETKRGRILFTEDETIIDLFKDANLSTFLHESGHLFLNAFIPLAQKEGAPQQLQDDMQAILDFLGVDAIDKLDPRKHGASAVEAQEKWARGIEAYLFEGKAPNEELRSAFQRFKAWMIHVYRSLVNLDVELNKEIRGVMDRMLATDDQIRQTANESQYRPIFRDAESANMTDAEYAKYIEASENATRKAEDDLTKEALKEITRERKRIYKEEKARVREEVETEINQLPEFQAKHYLQKGELLDSDKEVEPAKLSRTILIQMYGDSGIWKKLPFGKNSVWVSDGGVHPDVVAEMFGFESGDKMVQKMIESGNRKKAIDAETNKRMKDLHGDILSDGSIAEEATIAMNNNSRTNFIATELRALAKRAGQQATPKQVLRQVAERIISGKKVADIQPGRFNQASKRYADQAFKLLSEGKHEEALQAKQKQLLNHYLYVEGTKAKKEVERILKHVQSFGKKNFAKKIPADYLEQIESILNIYEFRKGFSVKKQQRVDSYAEWVTNKQEDGDLVVINDNLMKQAGKQHWRTLSFSEISALDDTLSNIETLGRLKNKLLINDELRKFEEVKTEFIETVESNMDKIKQSQNLNPDKWEKVGNKLESWVAELTKVSFMVKWMDGDTPIGKVHDILMQPANDATQEEAILLSTIGKEINDIFEQFTTDQRKRQATRVYIPEIGLSIDGADMMAVALNMGNESNYDKMLRGGFGQGELTDAQIDAVVSRLTREDWETVQKIWDGIDKLWVPFSEVLKRSTGVIPPKVEARPVTTKFGEFKGGYYPIVYDPAKSHRAATHEKQAEADLFANEFVNKNVYASAKHERTNYAAPILFDLGIVQKHMVETIHFISHYERINQLNKFTSDSEVRKIITEALGKGHYQKIRSWIVDMANSAHKVEPSGLLSDMFRHIRIGTTLVAMGFKASTGILQVSGLSISAKEIGARYVMRGIRHSVGTIDAMKQSRDFAFENSQIMKFRMTSMDRDMKNAIRKAQGATGIRNRIQELAFVHIGLIQTYMVDLPTWHGAYMKGLEDFDADTARAIRYADRIIEDTQGSGQLKDMSEIMRQQSEFVKMFTMFYTFFGNLFNQYRDVIRDFKSTKSIVDATTSLFFLMTIPVMYEGFMRGNIPDEDDEETFAEWLILNQALYSAQSIPFARDFVNGVLGDYGYNLTPLQATMNTGVRFSKKIAAGNEITESTVKEAVRLGGVILHIPTGQPVVMFDTLIDYSQGEMDDLTMRELFITGHRAE